MPRPHRTGNRLLDLLPETDLAALTSGAERIVIPLRTVVAEPEGTIRHAYFPLTCVFSAVVPLQDGSVIEAATIGREGMAGVELITDRPVGVYRVMLQIAGESLRVSADAVRLLLAVNGPLRRILERYILAVSHQSGQSAACNLRHTVEERMCRWLLMTHDRVGRDEFFLTQEFLGAMLGVRRQSVSLTAATLQKAGLIRYSRGKLTILNRPGLEASSCECYQVLRDNFERVMGTPG